MPLWTIVGVPSTDGPKRTLPRAMKRLNGIEWARNKGRTTDFNVALTVHAKSAALAWIDARRSEGWVYVLGDNFHFGSPLDAAAFRAWLLSELAA